MIAEHLCVVGVGLIGGSLARALRRAGACRRVTGVGRNPDHLREAADLGVIDAWETDAAAAAAEADLVVLAVPLGAMEPLLRAVAPVLREGAVVTDVGSAKSSVLAAARAALGAVPPWLVPGHPIAGTERSGVAASFAELFEGHRVILTPAAETDPAAVARVRRMWEHAGARVSEMDAAHHDRVLAATSHLPHVLAYALVDSLARLGEHDEVFEYAAGGFRDFTRIASSDPVMWRDICLANREAVLALIERYAGDLQRVTRAIADNDGDTLLEVFTAAKTARDAFDRGHRDDPGVDTAE